MTDHRIRTLRFWFAAFYAFLLLWFFPGHAWTLLALIPLALFMPVFSGTDLCTFCQSGTLDQTSVSVTIAGVTDGIVCTDCANWNATYTANWSGAGSPCNYFKTNPPGTLCGLTCTLCSMNAIWLSNGSFRVLLGDSTATSPIAVSSAVTTPRDCSDSTGLDNLPFDVDSIRCAYTTGTATVVI